MEANVDLYIADLNPTVESLEQTKSSGERLIRIALLTGFIAVLVVEAWLLLQALQIWG